MVNLKLRRRRGATAIEYGILAALIIMAILAFLTLTGVNLNNIFTGLGSSLNLSSTPAVQYASNCSPAAAENIPYYYDQDTGTQVTFPSYSCGSDGINGPPTSSVYTTFGDSWGPTVIAYQNSSGSQSIYAELASSGPNGPSNTGDMAYPGAFGYGF